MVLAGLTPLDLPTPNPMGGGTAREATVELKRDASLSRFGVAGAVGAVTDLRCLVRQPDAYLNTRKIERLAAQATAAHGAGRFQDEAALWRRIHRVVPGDERVLSNLATAEMEAGNLDEAKRLFDELLRRNPNLARAINNRAKLRLRLGVELRDLFPDFLRALELSESSDEFVWHSLNLCQCAAFGSDDGAPELFSTIRTRVAELIEQRWPEERRASQHEFFNRFVDAYFQVARYRTAIANRDWGTAELHLNLARKAFENAGLENLSRGVDGTYEGMCLCRQVFALLEDVAREQSLSPMAARDRAVTLRAAVEVKNPPKNADSQRRLYEVLGAFLRLFSSELEFLADPCNAHLPAGDEAQAVLWLKGSSFRSMGDDLLGISSFAARRCRDLSVKRGELASSVGLAKAAGDEWAKLALYISGRVLDFRDVDVALARAALGWNDDPVGRVKAELYEFRAYIERQAHKDIFVSGKPQENIARALLQARMSVRSYREVQVRGGRSDLLLLERDETRILIETKIWDGGEDHEQGKRELAEYALGENDDGKLLAAFYVVFDPTQSGSAAEYMGASAATERSRGTSTETIIIRIKPATPSRIPADTTGE